MSFGVLSPSRFLFLTTLFLFSWALGLKAQEPLKLVFIYPGGEGSTEEAQPIIDHFTETVTAKGGPALKGTYYSSREEGDALLKKKGADVGVISLDYYLTQKIKMPLSVLLATWPIASSGPSEQYHLIINSDVKPEEVETVYVSHDINQKFLREIILKASPLASNKTYQISSTPNMVPQLKKMGQEKARSAGLLNSFEFTAFKKMKLPWTQSLKVAYDSPQLPSAPLVSFKEISAEKKEKLINALIVLSQSPEGEAVLESLRLKGFEKPDEGAYKALEEAFSKAVTAEP